MSFIESLAQKGIDLVEGVGKGVTSIGTRMGVVPVEWPHDRRPGLVWKVPEPEATPSSERVTVSGIFSKRQPIVVREYERAIVLENGKLYAEIPSGLYNITKVPLKGRIEIIWVTLSQSQHPWGADGISLDGIAVGAHGSVFVRIHDATKFVLQMIVGKQVFTEEQIRSWIRGLVAGIMRRELALRKAMVLNAERDAFVEACRKDLSPLLVEMGLEFKHIEVEGFNLPPEFRSVLQGRTLVDLDRDRALIEADTKAKVTQIEALAEADRRRELGAADGEVADYQRRLGLDPLRMKAVDALVEYAKARQNSGGAAVSIDLDPGRIFSMLTNVLGDPTVLPQVKQDLRRSYPQEAAAIPQLTAAAEPSPTAPDGASVEAPMTVERIKTMLENLDMRLADGKISEETYKKVTQTLERKLQDLQAQAGESTEGAV